MRDRPLGVTILAVLMMLLGLWTLCGGLFGLAGFSLGTIGSLVCGAPSLEGGISAIFNLVWGILAILLGLGLWRLMRFAWLGTIIVLAVKLVFFVYAFFLPPDIDWIGTIITVLLLVYLILPGCKGSLRGVTDMKQLPAGVAILATLAAFAGVWSLCTGAFSLGMVSSGSVGTVFGLVEETDGLGFSSLYSVIWGVLALFFAWGLWNLKNWARIGTLALQLLNVAMAVAALIGFGSLNWVGALLGIVIIWYLTRDHIRQAFT